MSPVRIQRRRTKGWRMPEGTIYVGRPSRWGNPHISDVIAPRYAVAAYRSDLAQHEVRNQRAFRAWLAPLRGRDLACYCELCPEHSDGLPLGVVCPDCEPCHVDVLLAEANRCWQDPAWRKVRMTPELMRALSDAATARGNIIEWGEPDADGFYTPTVTLTDATMGPVQRALS